MEFFFSLVISSVGLAYFVYGKKTAELLFIAFGLGLMFYPYFVQNFLVSAILGTILAICPFVLRNLSQIQRVKVYRNWGAFLKKIEIELDQGARKDAIEEVQKYFATERDEEISNFTAGIIVDFFLSKIGPLIYNQAIQDAHIYMNERVEDLLSLEKRSR